VFTSCEGLCLSISSLLHSNMVVHLHLIFCHNATCRFTLEEQLATSARRGIPASGLPIPGWRVMLEHTYFEPVTWPCSYMYWVAIGYSLLYQSLGEFYVLESILRPYKLMNTQTRCIPRNHNDGCYLTSVEDAAAPVL
jgi:hypothetical protein